MERHKPWHLALIVAVILLTLYNILPTIFYHSQPLREPVDKDSARAVAVQMVDRLQDLEKDSTDWIAAYCKFLQITPKSINLDEKDPGLIRVDFEQKKEADLFRRMLPQAGAMIPFVPAQLALAETVDRNAFSDVRTVLVERKVAVHLKESDIDELFLYSRKYQSQGQPEELYRQVVMDRATEIAMALGGESAKGMKIRRALEGDGDGQDVIISAAKEIADLAAVLGRDNPIFERILYSYAFSLPAPEKVFDRLQNRFDVEKARLQSLEKGLKEGSQQQLEANQQAQADLKEAEAIIASKKKQFDSWPKPYASREDAARAFQDDASKEVTTLSLAGRSSVIQDVVIDWRDDALFFRPYQDVKEAREAEATTEQAALVRDRVNERLMEELALLTRRVDEKIAEVGSEFQTPLSQISNSESFLSLDLRVLAEKKVHGIQELLKEQWQPDYPDFARDVFPVHQIAGFSALPEIDKRLGLVAFAPAVTDPLEEPQLRKGSVYVVARGMGNVLAKFEGNASGSEAEAASDDFNALYELLKQRGFIAYPGKVFGEDSPLASDIVFELPDYYSSLLQATREEFRVLGSRRFAVLEFSDLEQRILATNRIEDRVQEDLLKWREAYQSAQVERDMRKKYLVPPPTKNVYVENAKLSGRKYFRGDERRILRWGLDLSGGKTVRVALRDQSGQMVSEPEDLNQAVNELYTRINKMGVAERSIRIENAHIVLDFPGSQGISAQDLIQASAMYFHVVNEKFGPSNAELASATDRFLQGVWNEAVVTNRKEAKDLNEIAWKHLGGDQGLPLNDAAKTLVENGLQIASPDQADIGTTFDDSLSSIAVYRGSDYSDWHGQSHPLLIVFRNYGLEGASLENVQVGYDPSKGNLLHFGVKSSYSQGGRHRGSPRDDFYSWTAPFSEEKVVGTLREQYSKGQGWRMAVILNGTVISAPTLSSPLRDNAMISGRFTQREVNQLAADLKAGSLSFTPEILSELNVSPELGASERSSGIMAAIVGLACVIALMIVYYRFAGVIAVLAVLFNLLILWGVLQNLGAALTLPGIAAIVLTIGMAVDANVLVFERIREEFSVSGKIASAIQAGYRKAFSAIVDSNLTTMLAALILIQFDSGPIRGFAVTLMVGIASSMFTALFMTRYFFVRWSRNPKNKKLEMRQWIQASDFDFLAKAKAVATVSVVIMVLGSALLANMRGTIFGMDFTGGYSLVVDLDETPGNDLRLRDQALEALYTAGVVPGDVDIRELGRHNHLRLQLSRGMDQEGRVFYGMPERLSEGTFSFEYEKNPRVAFVVSALEKAGLKIDSARLADLEGNWSAMSGQFSDAMRTNALMALGFSLIGILFYITLRFEFKYAMAAVVALIHDVVITLGILAIFHRLGFYVQIDLQVVGALMTIIGYSLNDTIIVFDRIREDVRLHRKMSFEKVVNHALNVTLSRTLMTSGTTLLVLLALVVLGGQAIFTFSLVMTVGVVFGTLSSLFIASPVMLFFHRRGIASGSHRDEMALNKL